MRATVIRGPFDIRLEEAPDPVIVSPSDALVRMTHVLVRP